MPGWFFNSSAAPECDSGLLLPGALLMAMGAQLLAPFMFVNLSFPTFL
jgi:hypothetical protein